MRYDHNSIFGGALSPRVGVSYLKNKNINIFGSIGRGFRALTFNETHIDGYGKIGNKDLNPEITTTYEVGVKSVYQQIQNTFSIFKQDISDKIELEKVTPGDPNSLETYRNGGNATIYGAELDGVYKLSSHLKAFYNGTVLGSDDGSGREIEKLIQFKLVLGLEYVKEEWSASLMGIHESEQFYYNPDSSVPDDSQDRVFVDALTLGNFQIERKMGSSLSMGLFVNNIGDHKYKEKYAPWTVQDGLYLMGRTIGVKLKANF